MKLDKLVLPAFCIIFSVFGIIGLFASYGQIKNGWDSKSWPVVEGYIIKSSSVKSSMKLAEVSYSYEYKGEKFKNSRLNFVAPMFEFFKPKPHDRYKVDDTVNVYVNPTNPKQAILEPGAPLGGIILNNLISLFFIVFGIVGCIYFLRLDLKD